MTTNDKEFTRACKTLREMVWDNAITVAQYYERLESAEQWYSGRDDSEDCSVPE